MPEAPPLRAVTGLEPPQAARPVFFVRAPPLPVAAPTCLVLYGLRHRGDGSAREALSDGEPLGGRSNAPDEFTSEDDEDLLN